MCHGKCTAPVLEGQQCKPSEHHRWPCIKSSVTVYLCNREILIYSKNCWPYIKGSHQWKCVTEISASEKYKHKSIKSEKCNREICQQKCTVSECFCFRIKTVIAHQCLHVVLCHFHDWYGVSAMVLYIETKKWFDQKCRLNFCLIVQDNEKYDKITVGEH